MDDLFLLVLLVGFTTFALRWLLAWGQQSLSHQTIRHMLLQRLLVSCHDATLISVGEELLSLRIGTETCAIHLDQLYRRCVEFPTQTGTFIRQIVQVVQLALADRPGLPEDWRQRVMALLLRTDTPAPPELVTRPYFDNLAIGYALHYEESFRWVTYPEIEEIGVTEEQLYEIGLRNLERSCSTLVIGAVWITPEGQDRMLRFNTQDGLDAARVLIPSFYQRFSPRFDDADVLVAIPTRDTLVMVSAQDTNQAGMITWRSEREHARAAYPLLETPFLITEHGSEMWKREEEETVELVDQEE
ncbi:MAG: DUF1444 family protein [Armatimonadota bacterium]